MLAKLHIWWWKLRIMSKGLIKRGGCWLSSLLASRISDHFTIFSMFSPTYFVQISFNDATSGYLFAMTNGVTYWNKNTENKRHMGNHGCVILIVFCHTLIPECKKYKNLANKHTSEKPNADDSWKRQNTKKCYAKYVLWIRTTRWLDMAP